MSQITTEAAGSSDAGQGRGAPQASPEPAPIGSDGTARDHVAPAASPSKPENVEFKRGIGIGKRESWREVAEQTGGRIKSAADIAALLAAIDAPPAPDDEPNGTQSGAATTPTKPTDPQPGKVAHEVTTLQRDLSTTRRELTRLGNEAKLATSENAALKGLIARKALELAAVEHSALYPDDVAEKLSQFLRVDIVEGRAEIVVVDAKGQATEDTPKSLVGSFTTTRPNWFGAQSKKPTQALPKQPVVPVAHGHSNGQPQRTWDAGTIAERMNAKLAAASGGRDQG